MKLIIAGGRNYHLTAEDYEFLDGLDDVEEVISGGATGADQDGEMWAISRDISVTRVNPNWSKHDLVWPSIEAIEGAIDDGAISDRLGGPEIWTLTHSSSRGVGLLWSEVALPMRLREGKVHLGREAERDQWWYPKLWLLEREKDRSQRATVRKTYRPDARGQEEREAEGCLLAMPVRLRQDRDHTDWQSTEPQYWLLWMHEDLGGRSRSQASHLQALQEKGTRKSPYFFAQYGGCGCLGIAALPLLRCDSIEFDGIQERVSSSIPIQRDRSHGQRSRIHEGQCDSMLPGMQFRQGESVLRRVFDLAPASRRAPKTITRDTSCPLAGPIRNRQMAYRADAVVLFPGGRGTESMAEEARDAGLTIFDRRSKG